MIYQQLKMPEKQKEYTEKGLTCAKQSGKNDALMLAYLQMASYYIELKDYSLAKTMRILPLPILMRAMIFPAYKISIFKGRYISECKNI